MPEEACSPRAPYSRVCGRTGGRLLELNHSPDFLDLALLYALINFIGTLAVLKFFEYGDLTRRLDGAEEG